MALFTASRRQIATYLLGVCPFSIAFLVFLNSTVSFVITDLIGQSKGVGNDVGTLGFADELVALVACPLWGLLSDRIGVRLVSSISYIIIALSLLVFVQAHSVYPQLLLARLLFSVGGAGASTMVTAILPSMSFNAGPARDSPSSRNHQQAPSYASDHTVTPVSYRARTSSTRDHDSNADASSKIAGLVGLATGCGALIALSIFLPLPARFQGNGTTPGRALQYSYYIVSGVAFLLAFVCLAGLQALSTETHKSIRGLWTPRSSKTGNVSSSTAGIKLYLQDLRRAFWVGFTSHSVFIGYVGGFVARASSVAISLFIPLLINAAFSSSGLCQHNDEGGHPGLPDLKRKCPRAYTLAAELTGASQLVALLSAPLIGFWSARVHNKTIPLGFAAVFAIVGYPLLALSFDPNDTNHLARAVTFTAVAMIGIGQIGAIVCSLAILSHSVLQKRPDPGPSTDHVHTSRHSLDDGNEAEALLSQTSSNNKEVSLADLKGSVAGVYSFYGGAGILLLTKVGGHLFDHATPAAPFYMMSAFNGVLLVAVVVVGTVAPFRRENR